jgi:hypothetical protein
MERRVKENGGRKTKKKEDISVNGRTAWQSKWYTWRFEREREREIWSHKDCALKSSDPVELIYVFLDKLSSSTVYRVLNPCSPETWVSQKVEWEVHDWQLRSTLGDEIRRIAQILFEFAVDYVDCRCKSYCKPCLGVWRGPVHWRLLIILSRVGRRTSNRVHKISWHDGWKPG